jgi:hypothetical protein
MLEAMRTQARFYSFRASQRIMKAPGLLKELEPAATSGLKTGAMVRLQG